MADMRVRLLLDLVNRLSTPAKAASRDIKGVGQAAKDLSKVRAGEQLSRDLDRTRASAARTASELRNMKLAMADFARTAAVAAQSSAAIAVPTRSAKAGAAVAGAAAIGKRTLVGAGVGLGGYGAVRGTVGQSVAFEKAMAAVQIKLDGMDDPKAFAKMAKLVSSAAIEYGRAREEVAALVAEGGASGISAGDMPEFIRLVLSAATAWDQTADKAANALAKIKAQTGATMSDLRDFGDMVNALSDAGSAKEMDVVEMFKRAGAAAKASGVDQKTALAFLTAMNNVGIEPEVAARGFNAITGSLAQATEQGDKFKEGLKMLGLNAKKLEKDMKIDATKAMIDVFQRLEKSADKGKAAIKLFGKEWWDEALRAGQALPEVIKNLDIVRDPKRWKGSMDKSLNIQLATTANHLERLKALASEVGDRLGKWALPPINAAIERLIAGLDELDKRSAKSDADASAVDATADKVDAGKPLTAEERKRMAEDETFRSAVETKVEAARGDRRNRSVTDNARLQELIKQRDELKASIDRRQWAGANEAQLAYSRSQLSKLEGEIGGIDKRATRFDPRRPADQEDRSALDYKPGAAGREARSDNLRKKVDALERLAARQSNVTDRENFLKDASTEQDRLLRSMAPDYMLTRMGRQTAPGREITASPGAGIKTSAEEAIGGKGAGPGRLGFGSPTGGPTPAGVGSLDWAKAPKATAEDLKKLFEIDLGPAGMTLAEKLAQGLKAGQTQTDGAAQQIGEGVKQKLSSVEAASAGQKVAADFAAGITAGGGAAVAAAEAVAAKVKSVFANAGSGSGGGGRFALNNAMSAGLHDGVA